MAHPSDANPGRFLHLVICSAWEKRDMATVRIVSFAVLATALGACTSTEPRTGTPGAAGASGGAGTGGAGAGAAGTIGAAGTGAAGTSGTAGTGTGAAGTTGVAG